MGEKRKEAPSSGNDWPSEGDERWLCFIRHGQALHNVCDDNLWTPDNPLTHAGEKSCETESKEWAEKVFKTADLVIVSPMARTLQTAYFLSGKHVDKTRWLVSDKCAEKLSGATCDEGIPKSKNIERLPWIKDLPGMSELAEEWWKQKRPEEEQRISSFMEYLKKRPEKKIIVVSHGGFLEYITGFYMQNAEHYFMPGKDLGAVKQKMSRASMNVNLAVSREFEGKPFKVLAKGTAGALQGLGRKKAALLAKLGPKTIDGLASWKFARWAEAVCTVASLGDDGARDFSHTKSMMNINKALDTEWEGCSFAALLDAPVSALEGVSESQQVTFNQLGIKTIKDLGTWKFYIWARAISTLAEVETPDGSS